MSCEVCPVARKAVRVPKGTSMFEKSPWETTRAVIWREHPSVFRALDVRGALIDAFLPHYPTVAKWDQESVTLAGEDSELFLSLSQVAVTAREPSSLREVAVELDQALEILKRHFAELPAATAEGCTAAWAIPEDLREALASGLYRRALASDFPDIWRKSRHTNTYFGIRLDEPGLLVLANVQAMPAQPDGVPALEAFWRFEQPGTRPEVDHGRHRELCTAYVQPLVDWIQESASR